MGALREYIIEQAEKKSVEPSQWLKERLDNIVKCDIATHIGKFSHPNSKINILDKNKVGATGYVTTAGAGCGVDIASNAALLPTAKLLLFDMGDGHSLFEYIQSYPEKINEEISGWGIDIFSYKELLCIDNKINNTEDILKQVYFPIGQNNYRLLTVMANSSILLELGRRLNLINQTGRECKDKKTEKYGEHHYKIMNQTAVSYGGTKPQNISTMNSKTGGKSYMLESLPPLFNYKVRFPKRNFFGEIVSWGDIKWELRQLSRLFKSDRNNIVIREKIISLIAAIIDRVIVSATTIQNEPGGWSDERKKLPWEQCIWLDDAQKKLREKDDWVHNVAMFFGRWLVQGYSKANKGDGVVLGDDEMKYFASYLEELLLEERRYR